LANKKLAEFIVEFIAQKYNLLIAFSFKSLSVIYKFSGKVF